MNKEKVISNVCLIKDCGRPTHKESEYCIFHASEKEKTEKEFIQALKEYINEIKVKDKDYDFGNFIFIGDIDFEKDLNVTTLKNASFWDATFKGNDYFWHTTFKGIAHFWGATFERNASFMGATFEGDANFVGATFEKNANFMDTTFERNASFMGATFKENADFIVKTIKGKLNFAQAIVPLGKTLKLDIKNKIIINFEKTYLENVYLELALKKEVLIDFSDALLRNTKTKKEQIENHILQEKNEEFSQAREVYLLLKNNFHSIGRYDDESWALKKEKDMERRSYSFSSFIKNMKNKEKKSKFTLSFNYLRTNYFKWLSLNFSNIIYGYGEKPQNLIFSAIYIIIVFAMLFSILGINSFEIIEKGNLLNKTTNYFLDCLYFSVVTFTTLGYGDLRPLEGCGRIFAGTEAFIGAFMIALFVYTFARRTGGR